MTHLQKRSPKKANAQGMIEFALILPILLMVLFGIIDLGWMVFNFSQLYNGLREGVRYGSVPGVATVLQYKDCAGIRGMLVAQAGFSGIKPTDSAIAIWYDDGRPLADSVLAGPYQSPAIAAQSQIVAVCMTSGGVNGYATESGTYVAPTGSTARATPFDIQNGDRIVIDVNVNVPFLTPFMKSLVQSGVNMHLRSARSIFPDGLSFQ